MHHFWKQRRPKPQDNAEKQTTHPHRQKPLLHTGQFIRTSRAIAHLSVPSDYKRTKQTVAILKASASASNPQSLDMQAENITALRTYFRKITSASGPTAV
ncbi:MAG TPA: hypothetical protein DEF45_07145 [Rhodopirellula sp.]|nr:hypothetical protein [Rhodopirellula sp.]